MKARWYYVRRLAPNDDEVLTMYLLAGPVFQTVSNIIEEAMVFPSDRHANPHCEHLRMHGIKCEVKFVDKELK